MMSEINAADARRPIRNLLDGCARACRGDTTGVPPGSADVSARPAECFPQEEVRVADRPVLRPRIDLVTMLEVEAGRLEGERVEEHVPAAALDGAALRGFEQPLPVA